MKKFTTFLIPLLILLLIASCSCSKVINRNNGKEPLASDTVVVIDNTKVDSLFIVISSYEDRVACLRDSVRFYQDSVTIYRDSIRYEDYINARRIEKVKYYISICEKNSNNKKFFYGWIRRAMSD